MTTANSIITQVLAVITSLSPGEAIPAEEADYALTVLNTMLKGWSASNLMIPYRTLESFSLAAGVNSRTIGTGAQLSTTRPDYVTAAYLRDANGVDYWVDTTMPKEVYDAIRLKTVSMRPTRLYYDAQYPNGVIYFESATDQAYTLYLESLKPMNQYTTLQTDIALPGEYDEPTIYQLVKRLAVPYGYSTTQNPDVKELIDKSEAFLKRKNIKPKQASFDAALQATPVYNIYQG